MRSDQGVMSHTAAYRRLAAVPTPLPELVLSLKILQLVLVPWVSADLSVIVMVGIILLRGSGYDSSSHYGDRSMKVGSAAAAAASPCE